MATSVNGGRENHEAVKMRDGNVSPTAIASKAGSATHVNLKYVSLVCLVLQNAALILMMRYTRNQPGDLYFTTTAVCITETLKMLTCILILLFQYKGNAVSVAKLIWETIIMQPVDTLKVAVPAFIYTLQNNLMYVGVSNLSAATFQVTYQLKILTTALFSVVMLRRNLAPLQWLAMFLLFAGVAIVQIQPTDPSKRAAEVSHSEQNPLHGFIAVVIACCFSGFSGVYFEKILKGSKTSIWIRNIQLGSIGALIGLITMIIKDGPQIQEKGMLFGYTRYVWSAIGLQAFGGLTVAVVVKYADNILKGFATSVSIIVSTIAAVYLFHFQINMQFCFGAGLVIVAIYIYGRPKPPEKSPNQEQQTQGSNIK